MPQLLGDAVGIAVVTFVVTVSIGKLFAKKHGYRTNPTQVTTIPFILSIFPNKVGSFNQNIRLLKKWRGV
jgi:hypothetical protein